MTETTIDGERTLGDLVEETPAYARTFESLGIDYCCGGDRSLADACAEAGIDLEDATERLEDARREDADTDYDWETLAELADHVVDAHHEYLREELPALEELVAKVARVHGEGHPELEAIESEFDELAAEMREHIEEEETDLFPVVEKLDRGESLDGEEVDRLREAIDGFEDDHAATADRLDRIAELSDDYAVPEDACMSYRRMLDRLEALERDTHMHVHKENNVLFAEVEQRLPAEG